MDAQTVYREVQKHYSSAAHCESTEYASSVAKAFGYSDEELANVPPGANLGLSCGNPTALGSLKEGETVIDFGSGAGFDVFLAASKVGPNGKAIGVDMNKDMLAKANENKRKVGAANVEFIESVITKVALPDGIADCVISNCVINLVPEDEKRLVFREMARLLKPGGRAAISDILAKKPFPQKFKGSIALVCGCISGASLKQDYETYLRDAGFEDIAILDNQKDLNVYTDGLGAGGEASSCCGADKQPIESTSYCGQEDCAKGKRNASLNIKDIRVNEWAGSFNLLAVKVGSK